MHRLLQEDPGIQFTLYCALFFTLQHNMHTHTHTHVRAHTLCCPHSLNLKLQPRINKWINFLCEGVKEVMILFLFLYDATSAGIFCTALWLNVHTGDTFSISVFIVASLHMADGSLVPQLLHRARVPHPGQPIHALFTFLLTRCIARPLLCLNTRSFVNG